jgi:hypothetical protein
MAAEVSPYGVRPGLATGLGTIDNFGASQQYMPGGAGTAEAKAGGDDPARKAAIQAQIRDLERTLAALKAQI